MLQEMIDALQANVNGTVRMKLYKGHVIVAARKSESDSVLDERTATFEEGAGACHQGDAEGFTGRNALRLRIAARRND